jgi:hypothetical protein
LSKVVAKNVRDHRENADELLASKRRDYSVRDRREKSFGMSCDA